MNFWLLSISQFFISWKNLTILCSCLQYHVPACYITFVLPTQMVIVICMYNTYFICFISLTSSLSQLLVCFCTSFAHLALLTKYRYDPEVKRFAATVAFYSPKAYEFLREHFHLPDQRTLRLQLNSTRMSPGFISKAFHALSKLDGRHNFCAVMVDGMAIRKVRWDWGVPHGCLYLHD